MILGGCGELNAIEWRCVIIDEAHRLKNKNCKLLEGLKLMNLVSNLLFDLMQCLSYLVIGQIETELMLTSLFKF